MLFTGPELESDLGIFPDKQRSGSGTAFTPPAAPEPAGAMEEGEGADGGGKASDYKSHVPSATMTTSTAELQAAAKQCADR
jgi:hypothetical protein